MADNWNSRQTAAKYAKYSTSPQSNWYELAVNEDSVASLIPDNIRSILDFGCGPGDFTAQLANEGYIAEGCDGSAAMIDLARQKAAQIPFFVWDGLSTSPMNKRYDAVVTKLTLHFVDDLDQLACHFCSVLNKNGVLVISVPHPFSTMTKTSGSYFQTTRYDTEIGTYDMTVTMIHRSIQEYIRPFVDNGYVLSGIDEPPIPNEVVKKYNVKERYLAGPRRLNLRFIRS